MQSTSYPIGFPTKYINWKGKTFFQIVASIQKNTNKSPSLSVKQLFHPLPLSIYRREIHNISGQATPKNCNSRFSTKISDFETPGNNTVSSTQKSAYSNGIICNVEETNPTTISADAGNCNTPASCFLSPQNNARKRCRSAGMIPRKFNVNKNNDTYSTSTQQYLVSRNRSIKQNEYNYIRKGSSGIVPGPGLAASNVYSPAGLSHCSQPTISAANGNNTFFYNWIDGTQFQVTIPDGIYDIESLNQLFKTEQVRNKTYLVAPGYNKQLLMNLSYDTKTGSIILYAGVTSQANCSSNGYTAPFGATWTIAALPATNPTPTGTGVIGATYFQVPHTNFPNLIGFPTGVYFAGINESSFQGEITPKYVALYYKPNNPEYAVQGAVDASTRIQRLKYETVNAGAGGVRTAYGDATANALAYGVSEQAYTEKTQVGDKVIYTPVINPKTGQICKKQFIYR